VQKEILSVNSAALGQTMNYRVYGESGKPVIAFPTSQAHENLWEDFGMVDVLGEYIENGDIQLFALDSIDDDTFFREDGKRGAALKQYEKYLSFVANEFIPTVSGPQVGAPKALLTGCSMGAYHAANIYFRWPHLADSLIALSGVYSTNCFLDFDNHMSAKARENSPLEYLQKPIAPKKRDLYTSSRLVFCAGQGSGEEPMLADTVALGEVLGNQGINAWVDVWGNDATHDWPWWQQQIQYFLPEVLAA
jgi:esterase/lipase superfamily enzyme